MGPAASRVRSAITGGPGAGKSTLLEALAGHGIATVPEAARIILRRPGGLELRAHDPDGFACAMFEAERTAFDGAGPGLTVFDRGFPDIAGFLDLAGLPVPAGIDRACRSLRYEGPVFHAPMWQAIYTGDEERIQTWDEALESDAAVLAAWRRYGYDPIELPRESVASRVRFVERWLGISGP
ncbi:MAG: ATP-binding protein [Sphingomonadales bacterium]|nr:ATP-binding protein [Sphingomonadales bacterium]MDE2568292.1 ATP-binding protein [Sphingomonadales bacterium]